MIVGLFRQFCGAHRASKRVLPRAGRQSPSSNYRTSVAYSLHCSAGSEPRASLLPPGSVRGGKKAKVAIIGKSTTFELNGFLFNLPERTTVCSVVICSRPLRRRDDKQSDPNKYGQQNRQGDKSAKSGQNPNQTPGQQTQNPNQGGQQSSGQQRGPQR
jgi:hypothetical protein